ncbi:MULTISPECIES: hypothetical protein [unclassified Pseudomonas]|uniref:hypothetical protein n=1 Tax=unclassified Pseudomonas TaxID=196821 RepID=UPI000CD1F3F5|nr:MULTISPECIES: hypothetical protein [unclassified Pseudomonas]POA35761.1 hypothetical protein C1887_01350 [Pseudomonas sp. GW456-R21]POA71658.1 hypothetical protein C1884_00710 [Pseudomonas sp. GW460-R15]
MLVASTGIGFSYDVYGTKVYPSPEMIDKLFVHPAEHRPGSYTVGEQDLDGELRGYIRLSFAPA